jgi:hypothetical protein
VSAEKTVTITAQQYAELRGGTIQVPLSKFIEMVDAKGPDAPVWACELAFKLEGPRQYK